MMSKASEEYQDGRWFTNNYDRFCENFVRDRYTYEFVYQGRISELELELKKKKLERGYALLYFKKEYKGEEFIFFAEYRQKEHKQVPNDFEIINWFD